MSMLRGPVGGVACWHAVLVVLGGSQKSRFRMARRCKRCILIGLLALLVSVKKVDGAFNVYRNLGESMVQSIRQHIVFPDHYNIPQEEASPRCNSMEGAQCFALKSLASRVGPISELDRGWELPEVPWKADTSFLALKRGSWSDSTAVLEDGIGDDTDAERFAVVLADGISWLVTHEGVLSQVVAAARTRHGQSVRLGFMSVASSEEIPVEGGKAVEGSESYQPEQAPPSNEQQVPEDQQSMGESGRLASLLRHSGGWPSTAFRALERLLLHFMTDEESTSDEAESLENGQEFNALEASFKNRETAPTSDRSGSNAGLDFSEGSGDALEGSVAEASLVSRESAKPAVVWWIGTYHVKVDQALELFEFPSEFSTVSLEKVYTKHPIMWAGASTVGRYGLELPLGGDDLGGAIKTKEKPWSVFFSGTSIESRLGMGKDVTDVSLRWVGGWRNLAFSKDNTTPASVGRACLGLDGTVLTGLSRRGVSGAILFSRPVLLTEIFLAFHEAVVGPGETSIPFESSLFSAERLVVSGWHWNAHARREIGSRASGMGLGGGRDNNEPTPWFYTSAPVAALEAGNVTVVWSAQILRRAQTGKTGSEQRVEVLSAVQGSSYIRVDGISFRIVGGERGEKSKRREETTAALNGGFCLQSLRFRRLLPSPRGGQPVPQYFPGVVILETGTPQQRMHWLSLTRSPSAASDAQAAYKEIYYAWEAGQKAEAESRRHHYRQTLRYSAQLLSSPSPFIPFPDHQNLPLPEVSSDGTVINGDHRPLMQKVVFLLQQKLPVEAPVLSIFELQERRMLVGGRPNFSSHVNQDIVLGHFTHPGEITTSPPRGFEGGGLSPQQSDPLEQQDTVGSRDGADNADVPLHQILLKRRLLEAARAAVSAARRSHQMRKAQISAVGTTSRTGTARQQSSALETSSSVSSATMQSEEPAGIAAPSEDKGTVLTTASDAKASDDWEGLSNFLEKEMTESLKEVLEQHRRAHLDQHLSALQRQAGAEPQGTPPSFLDIKEIDIVEVYEKDGQLVTKKVRVDLGGGTEGATATTAPGVKERRTSATALPDEASSEE